MRALVLHGIGDLRLDTVPDPQPGAGEVRVRVAACGVCGSDIPRIFSKGTYTFPTIPGHEFAGTVDALGDGVDDLPVGQPVAVFPLLWCGGCSACEKGAYVQCEGYGYLGSRNDGGFAEFVVAPRRNLVPVPAGLDLGAAALTEPAAVALHALRRVPVGVFGRTSAIFGLGPIGLMAAQWARSMGGRVLGFEVSPAKLELARSLGFTDVFDSAAVDARSVVDQATEGRGAAVCVEAAGVPGTMVSACDSVARGGHVVLLGNPSRDVSLPASTISQLMRREAGLLGTWNSDYSMHGLSDDWRPTLQAMADGSLDVLSLVSHRVGLSQAVATLGQVRDEPGAFAKVLIDPKMP